MNASRVRGAKPAPRDAPLDAVAEEAIERFARVLARCGYAAHAATRAFVAAMATIHGGPKRARSPRLLRELPDAAHMVTLWCSSPDYVDEQGTPYRLPARGPGRSLEGLIRRVNRSLDLDEVLRYLVRTHTIRKIGKTYALNRRWIFLRGVSGSAHSHSIRGLVGMLRTLEHNLLAETDAKSWFEFTAENPRFPVSQLAAFDRRLRRVGLGCLRKLDMFMQQCEAERDPTEPTVRVGVGMHRFQHDLGGPASRSHPSAQNSSRGARRSRRRRPA